MPTVNLNPSSTVSNNWPTLSGSTAHAALSDSSTTTYIRTPDSADLALFELDNYSAGGTINSIRFGVSGYTFLTRGGDTDISVRLLDSSGSTYYAETVTLNFNGYVAQDHYGTARTTYDGSSAWDDTKLDDLRLSVDTIPEDPPGVSQATVVKAWVEVTYTAAGYGNNVNGVAAANISKVNGIATASISKVNGI